MAANDTVTALMDSARTRPARETAALAAAVKPKRSEGLGIVAALIKRGRG